MDKQLDFGAFLASQESEGKVDSQGQFTISHNQASRKLAKFALPRVNAWASKLVQAAVGWGCKCIQIRQNRTETLFHFTMAKLSQIPTEDAIVSHILSGKIGGHEPIDAFCLALRALVEQAGMSFILVADDGEITPRPIYAGAHYSSVPEKERLSQRYHPMPGLSLTVYHRTSVQISDTIVEACSGARGSIPIIKELDSYCYPCPIPIILEGRRIDSLIQSPSLGLSLINRPIAFLGVQGILAQSPAQLPLPEDFETKLPSLLTHPRRLARKYGGEREFQAVFVLSLNIDAYNRIKAAGSKANRLLWISNGVVVETESLSLLTKGISLTIFANAAGLATDLTGFSLLKDEVYEARRQEIIERMIGEFVSPRINISHLFAVDQDNKSASDREFDEEVNTQNRIKRILKGSSAGLALTLVNPILGVPTTLGTIITTYTSKPISYTDLILERRSGLEEIIKSDLHTLKYYFSKVFSGIDLSDGVSSKDGGSESSGSKSGNRSTSSASYSPVNKSLRKFLTEHGIDKKKDFDLQILSNPDLKNNS